MCLTSLIKLVAICKEKSFLRVVHSPVSLQAIGEQAAECFCVFCFTDESRSSLGLFSTEVLEYSLHFLYFVSSFNVGLLAVISPMITETASNSRRLHYSRQSKRLLHLPWTAGALRE